jgi:hypothetical protein
MVFLCPQGARGSLKLRREKALSVFCSRGGSQGNLRASLRTSQKNSK